MARLPASRNHVTLIACFRSSCGDYEPSNLGLDEAQEGIDILIGKEVTRVAQNAVDRVLLGGKSSRGFPILLLLNTNAI